MENTQNCVQADRLMGTEVFLVFGWLESVRAGLFVLFILSCFDCDCSTFSTATFARALFEEVVVPPHLTGFQQTPDGFFFFLIQ